ncbi:hypothetical protein IKW73_02370 [Candidatus Saccharibacteria bacterium]|nr:hypothetical protein [Candidatus Saccharibacteria bacterium]
MTSIDLFEEERDKAYLAGLVDNFEKINELSPNEKEQMRHDCVAEMARTKQTIISLHDEEEKRKRKVNTAHDIFRYILIFTFILLFRFARYKNGDLFILIAIVVGGILFIIFANTSVFIDSIGFIFGLLAVKDRLIDSYKKYGDLEARQKLADYRGLNNDARVYIVYPQIKKEEEGSSS